MIFWLIAALTVAFIVGTISWVSPSPHQKAVANLRELAISSGWLIKRQTYEGCEKHQINWRDYSHELMRYSFACEECTHQGWAVCYRFGSWQWMGGEKKGHVPSKLVSALEGLPTETCMVLCMPAQMSIVWVENTKLPAQEVLSELKAKLEHLRTINVP